MEYTYPDLKNEPDTRMQLILRDMGIIDGTDYAVAYKYGKTHILCDKGCVEPVTKVAAFCAVTIHSWHYYEQ